MPDPAPVVVRRAAPADRDALVRLWVVFMAEQAALDARVAPSDDAEPRWRASLPDFFESGDLALFVGEVDGAVAGFLTAERYAAPPVYADVPGVYLNELYVVPDARRQGVATALFSAARAWAESTGAGELRMGVLARNEAARSLVEAWGAEAHAVTYAFAVVPTPREAAPRVRMGF